MSRATRGSRGAMQGDARPSRRQETFKVTSERAQQARIRAQQCFLSMIEGPVEAKVFIAKARYINPEVYDDVVVERAVAGLCGYPVCCNAFTDIYGSRTYVICNNSLYDITGRRNFCSNVCFEASELVRKQVLTLPLYLRDTQDSDIKDIRLPCLTKLKGRHGKLVDITGGISKLDLGEDEKPRNRSAAFMSVDDIARESLVNWSENEADLNKEQDKSSAEVSDISGAKLSTIPENEDTNESRTTGERNKSNQNRTSTRIEGTSHSKTAHEEIGRECVQRDGIIDNSKTNQNKTTVESDDSNQNKVTSEEIKSEQAKNTDDVKGSSEEGSPLASPSENQQRDLYHHKEGVGEQSDSDVQKQLSEEENLSKEDFESESTKDETKETEVCDVSQEKSITRDEVRRDSVQEHSIHNKEDYSSEKFNKEGAGNIDTSRNVSPRKDQQLESDTSKTHTPKKEGAEGSGACEDVFVRSDQKLKSGAAKRGTHKREFCEASKSEDVVVDPLAEAHKVEAMMRQWMSFDSLRVVLGDLYVRGMLEHLGHSWDNFDTTSGLRLSVEAKVKYISMCRWLEHEERQDEVEGERENQDKLDLNSGKQSRPSKPLPDYSQLQRQAKKQQLKVVSFLGGSDQYEEPVDEDKLESIPEEEGEESKSSAKKKLKSKKQSENADARDPTLPFVDSYSQVAWRQSIVVEKVTTYLQQLLEMMRLSVLEVKKLLGPLVATFHLSPDNISFRPKQWRLITLILLKMLSVRYPIIQDALRTEEGLGMQGAILSAFSLDLGYCDRVLSYLTEIQHILSKDFKDEKTVNAVQDAEVIQKPDTEENVEASRVKKSGEGENLAQAHINISEVRISDTSMD